MAARKKTPVKKPARKARSATGPSTKAAKKKTSLHKAQKKPLKKAQKKSAKTAAKKVATKTAPKKRARPTTTERTARLRQVFALPEQRAFPGRSLEGHTAYVQSLAFSPDGKRLVTVSEDATVKVWDVDSGQCTHTLTEHRAAVNSVAISADGAWMWTASDDETVRRWYLRGTPAVERVFRGHNGYVSEVRALPGGCAVSAGADGTVRTWDPDKGQGPVETLEHGGWVQALAVARDKVALASSTTNVMRLWDLNSGMSLPVVDAGRSYVGEVAGLLLVGKNTSGRGHESFPKHAEVLEDGFVTFGREIIAWGLDERGARERWTTEIFPWPNVGVPVPGARLIACGDGAGVVRLIDARTGHVVASHKVADEEIHGLAASPDGAHIALGLHKGRVVLVACDDLMALAPERHTSAIGAVDVSPSGTRAITGAMDGTARVWDLETGATAKVVVPAATSVGPVLFVDDERALVMHDTGQVRLVDVVRGAVRAASAARDGYQPFLLPRLIGPAGARRLLAGSTQGTLRSWALDGLDRAPTLFGGELGHCTALAVDEARDLCAAAAYADDKEPTVRVRVWHLSTGKPVGALTATADGYVSTLSFVDGAVVAGTSKGTLLAWDGPRGGKRTVRVDARVGGYFWTSASLDGRRALVVSDLPFIVDIARATARPVPGLGEEKPVALGHDVLITHAAGRIIVRDASSLRVIASAPCPLPNNVAWRPEAQVLVATAPDAGIQAFRLEG